MNTRIRQTVFASVVLLGSGLGIPQIASAQEAAMVYAANVMTTHTLRDMNATLTAHTLAKEFSTELTEQLNIRLPEEQAQFVEALKIRENLNKSILQELDVRLLSELRSLASQAAN